MPLKTPLKLFSVRIFISSSSEDEAVVLRQRVRDLIQVVNLQLSYTGSQWVVQPLFWESVVAQRAQGGNINDLFVEMAKESDHTLALLVKELRPGTRDEIIAVLGEDDVELSILIFPPGGDLMNSDAELRSFLEDHKNDLLYNLCGAFDSDEAWLRLVGVLLQAVFRRQLISEPEAYFENR